MQMKVSVALIKWKWWVLSGYIKVWDRALSSSSSYPAAWGKGQEELPDFDKGQILVARWLGKSIS